MYIVSSPHFWELLLGYMAGGPVAIVIPAARHTDTHTHTERETDWAWGN